MAFTFSAILNAINRKPGEKLNVLLMNESEEFQCSLAKTNHNLYVLQHPQVRSWDIKIRQCPNNIFVLPKADINKQIYKNLSIDIVLCQNRYTNYQILSSIASALGCPLICVEHNYPNTECNEFLTRNLADQPSNLNIFSSTSCRDIWGIDGKIIQPGIDTDYFNEWDGIVPKALIIADNYNQKHRGFEIFQQLCSKFPIALFGNNGNNSQPPKSMKHYLQLYREHRLFVNTSTWDCNNIRMLEAMAVGCPIITTNTGNHGEIIQNNVNGFITNNIDEMIQHANKLLNDRQFAEKIGKNARQTAIDRFNEKNLIESYNNMFENIVGKASSPITGYVYEN